MFLFFARRDRYAAEVLLTEATNAAKIVAA
jgi:hypothetical protein